MRFVDTNVLLYALSTAPDERSKAEIARRLLEAEDLALSVPVLQEFYVQATHARRKDALSHEQASGLVEAYLRYPALDNTIDLMRAALRASAEYQIGYWDAAIIEAARALGCSVVLSEDLNAGQHYGGVNVVNPFS